MNLVAAVIGTAHAVVGNRVSPVLAISRRVAGLNTSAEQAVVTVRIVDGVDYDVVQLVAAVIGAEHPVVGNRVSPVLAVSRRVAGLYARAVEPVVAISIVGGVDYDVVDLVARVIRAGYAVVGNRISPVLAVSRRVAGLYASAVEPVVAV